MTAYDKMAYCRIDPYYISKPNPAFAHGGFALPNPFTTEERHPEVAHPLYKTMDKVIRVGDLAEQLLEEAPKERRTVG